MAAEDKARHSAGCVFVIACLFWLSSVDLAILSGNHGQHTDHPGGAAKQCFEAGMVRILVATGHSVQSCSNIPWDTAGDLKMHMHCNLRG